MMLKAPSARCGARGAAAPCRSATPASAIARGRGSNNTAVACLAVTTSGPEVITDEDAEKVAVLKRRFQMADTDGCGRTVRFVFLFVGGGSRGDRPGLKPTFCPRPTLLTDGSAFGRVACAGRRRNGSIDREELRNLLQSVEGGEAVLLTQVGRGWERVWVGNRPLGLWWAWDVPLQAGRPGQSGLGRA